MGVGHIVIVFMFFVAYVVNMVIFKFKEGVGGWVGGFWETSLYFEVCFSENTKSYFFNPRAKARVFQILFVTFFQLYDCGIALCVTIKTIGLSMGDIDTKAITTNAIHSNYGKLCFKKSNFFTLLQSKN